MATKNVALEKRATSDLERFRELLSKARHIVILTGAGVSAESGVPTFRGAGGFWRTYQAQELLMKIPPWCGSSTTIAGR